ncbi:uncharacterized protein LOC106708038 [Papilio machaon]|uniref:uncharacterized protein LOC106708038 n=1 Tax=Papilio machaon TaxID=76193 RepID=UPI001E66402F|nr:uncharacterized protein LOC106708038 [Papilio machaon]
MNRNMMRGRGRGGASNSFVSSHMRNLNTEMELLQRKREALQYEQQRLVNDRANMRKRPYESDVPSRSLPYYQTQSSVQNFSHLYDDGSERSFGAPQPKRRAPVNVWDDNRFNVNQSSVPQRPGSYVAPNPPNRAQPMPLMGVLSKPVGRRVIDMPLKRLRSKFITGTQFTSAPVQVKTKPMQLPVLRATEEPNNQLHGRLGLALGMIIKKMKEEYCVSKESTEFFNTKHMQRYMRKTIRERLTIIMLNKPVGRSDEIVAEYRKVFPPHTDKHILDNANVNADFDKYLKFNISRIMTDKLGELLEKMKQLCEGKDVEVRKLIKPLASASSGEEKIETNKDVKLTQDYMNALTVALIEENLPQLLPKYTQRIIKMLNLETEVTNFLDRNMRGKHLTRNEKKKQADPTITENLDNDEDISVVKIENRETNDDPIEISEEDTQNEIDKDIENGDNLDKTIEEPKSVESTEKAESAQLATPKTQQYFVKVLGQPSLPNRADAYKFFSSLNAVTIKKHKVIQNLLVVGFDNEQDYEKAVAASDTVVGNCKLIIKTNDKQALSTTTTPSKEKTESDKSEAMLSPDLENQITDLLSTIKREQADAIENTESSNSEQANTEQSTTVQSNTEKTDATVKEENTTTVNEANGDNTVEENSPNKELDEAKNLDTIQEVDESNTEPKTNIANVKNDTGKGTPMKTRQSVATPRTIRTRRSSKLEQQNN